MIKAVDMRVLANLRRNKGSSLMIIDAVGTAG